MKYIYIESWETPQEIIKSHRVLQDETEVSKKLETIKETTNAWKQECPLYEESEVTNLLNGVITYNCAINSERVRASFTPVNE